MASPDGKQVWVTFAFPDNHKVQVIDVQKLEVVKNLEPGKGVLHMEFTPRGEQVWLSVRDEDKLKVFNTKDFEEVKSLAAKKPSGIFFTSRANKIGL
jgi:protein NirF